MPAEIRFATFLFFVSLLLSPNCQATEQGGRPFPDQTQAAPGDEQQVKLQREQAKAMNKERQENLKRDTDKLLQLATELKHYVDKSNENVLSLDVIKRAEAIEKLARSIKGKMKGD